MGLNITITATSGAAVRVVPDDVAEDLKASYEALASLPNTRVATVKFDTVKEASEFVKDGKAWSTQNGLTFVRKGVVKDDPQTVHFRIYKGADTEKATEEGSTKAAG